MGVPTRPARGIVNGCTGAPPHGHSPGARPLGYLSRHQSSISASSMPNFIDFSDHESGFGQDQCVVVGVSRDDCLTHAEFRQHGFSATLLSPTTHIAVATTHCAKSRTRASRNVAGEKFPKYWRASVGQSHRVVRLTRVTQLLQTASRRLNTLLYTT